jgi:hypothetical protein
MTRTVNEIRNELAAFESQFLADIIPKGTPDRRQLQRDADDARSAIARRPDNIKRRRELMGAIVKAKRAEQAAIRRELRPLLDPFYDERQRVFRALRKLGFRREYASGRSAYYTDGLLSVRISDHDVPMTPEREWNCDNGGRSWANSALSLVIGRDDADEWLMELESKRSYHIDEAWDSVTI